MKHFFSSHVLTNPLVLGAGAIVALIAVGSGAYYISGVRSPSVSELPPAVATTTITGTGTVEPSQNPDLAFESSGRVTHVYVAVGDAVSQGQTLATLDASTLSAQRAQAVAGLNAAQATLEQMQAGARDVDIQAKQTALAQAQLSVNNLYATVSDVLSDAYGKTYSAVQNDTNALFNNPNSTNATLAFTTSDSASAINSVNVRVQSNGELTSWSTELAALSTSNSTAQLDAAITADLAHLSQVRDYANTLTLALAGAVQTSSFSQATISADITLVGAMRDIVTARISALQALQQQIAAGKLAVQSAQDSLNQTLAGSTKQQLDAQQAQVEAAQANVASVDAQIAKTVIVAPFSGSVASVRVKTGDIISPDVAVISLIPKSALQVSAYFSEVDAASITVGMNADVTLDAYGAGRVFPATVVSVDKSPTEQNGVPAYKVVLQFAQSDPAIAPGMTANATINQ